MCAHACVVTLAHGHVRADASAHTRAGGHVHADTCARTLKRRHVRADFAHLWSDTPPQRCTKSYNLTCLSDNLQD